jgi:hypothetical protein
MMRQISIAHQGRSEEKKFVGDVFAQWLSGAGRKGKVR